MNVLTSLLLIYVVNSVWQVSLILLAAWIAARLARPAGLAAEHRVWVGALVLEGVLPAISTLPWERMPVVWPWYSHAATVVNGNVAVVMGGGTGVASLRLPPALAAMLVATYCAVTAYFAIRFVWHCVRLSRLSRSANPVNPRSDAAAACERWRKFGGSDQVVFGFSAKIFAPVTLGISVKRVLLPEGLMQRLTAGDLDTAIAHELAHIRRNDFGKNLVYEIISLPVSYHPALWFTRQRLTETREMVCDELAAQNAGRHKYAQSLLRLASMLLQGRPVRVPQAIGVFDSNTLERRLMKLTETKKQAGLAKRVVMMAACVVLGLATAGSAVALRLAVGGANEQALQKKTVSVRADVMAKTLVKKVTPVYPPEAKAAKIQGKVELHAVIGKSGHVENLKAVSGPNELQQSAIDAVRQWEYKPFLLNGEPVEVQTTISVIYSLEK